jgi:hypothetical protein
MNLTVNAQVSYPSASETLKTDEAPQKKTEYIPNEKLYTFEEFFNIVHGQPKAASIPGERSLITDRLILPRAHSIVGPSD